MKYNILNFVAMENEDLKSLESVTNIVHAGVALGERRNPNVAEVKELLKELKPDILIVNSLPITKEHIDIMKNTKIISCARGNPLNIDVEYCKEKNIIVTCTPGRNANAVAEYSILLMLSLLRNLVPAIDAIKTKACTLDKDPSEINPNAKDIVWMHPDLPYFPYNHFSGKEIKGTYLGLIGFGHIGQLFAEKAKALGMNILVYDPFIPKDVLDKFQVESCSLEELFKNSDVVSLHAKATKDTEGMINENSLSIMKSSAILLNTARSTLVNTRDLLKSLEKKQILGAAIDVFDYEPLSSRDIFLEKPLDNLIITPHIGGATKDVPCHQSRMIRESVQSYIDNKDIPYRVK